MVIDDNSDLLIDRGYYFEFKNHFSHKGHIFLKTSKPLNLRGFIANGSLTVDCKVQCFGRLDVLGVLTVDGSLECHRSLYVQKFIMKNGDFTFHDKLNFNGKCSRFFRFLNFSKFVNIFEKSIKVWGVELSIDDFMNIDIACQKLDKEFMRLDYQVVKAIWRTEMKLLKGGE